MAKRKVMNPWLKHLQSYRRAHPKMTLTEAMKKAKKTYKK